MNQLARGLLDLLAPPLCRACRKALDRTGGSDSILCASCRVEIEWLPSTGCARCQAPLPIARHEDPPGRPLCDSCRERPSPLLGCSASVVFASEVERWMHRFKYPGRGLTGLAPEAESIVCSWILDAADRAALELPGVLIPIPMHDRRLKERGFNPALVLARALARRSGLRLSTDSLRRSRDTVSQTRLSRAARRDNVAGAFAGGRQAAPEIAWLVDDVVTTGATLEEAARCLLRSGAREVRALCAARTLVRSGRQSTG